MKKYFIQIKQKIEFMENIEFQKSELMELQVEDMKIIYGGIVGYMIAGFALGFAMASKAFDLGREYARK